MGRGACTGQGSLKSPANDSGVLRNREGNHQDRRRRTHLADRPALKLSGGEKQKLSLARSWATRPEVLFLDEPTANLDPRSTHDMENLINQIYQTGTKIIITTHDMPQVRRLADEICFIHQGKIIEHGPANKLLESPENPMTAAFVNGELLI